MKREPWIVLLLILNSCSGQMKKLETVSEIELQKYTGKWYEIARLPNSFEKGLVCVSANYELRDDGRIGVTNAGRKENDISKVKSIHGKAWIPDKSEPGRLKVRFFWPFSGEYCIFYLDKEHYQYALVGNSSRKFMWVLSRTPQMDESLYLELMTIAQENGFATDRLLLVKQDCE